MPLKTLLNMPVTVRRLGAGADDDHGNPTETVVDEFDALAFIGQAALAQDARADGMSQVANSFGLLVIGGETGIGDGDQIVDPDGDVWTVDGRPIKVWSPRMGRQHHLEAKITRAE
jgi:hypothetical protein